MRNVKIKSNPSGKEQYYCFSANNNATHVIVDIYLHSYCKYPELDDMTFLRTLQPSPKTAIKIPVLSRICKISIVGTKYFKIFQITYYLPNRKTFILCCSFSSQQNFT